VTASDLPLVVDLDGTLLQSDLLFESFFSLLAHDPTKALRAAAGIAGGRAALKARLAEDAKVDFRRLPWNSSLVAYLRDQRHQGRKIYLASASNQRFVDAVAEELGLFDGTFGSDEVVNLKGKAKARRLCDTFGDRAFDYIGNDAADFDVWEKAANVVVVSDSSSFVGTVKARWPQAQHLFGAGAGLIDGLKVLRPHQWLKNLLIFLPTLAAHEIDAARLGACLLAFVSFSLCASSVYCLNDLIDLARDRSHPTKRHRGFASGRVPLAYGLWLYPGLLAASLALAVMVGAPFVITLLAYGTATLAYSLWLKRMMMVDVVTLACLYGVRLVAGSAVAAVPISSWLAAFALFFFFSLAIVKRYTELIARSADEPEASSGRSYTKIDLPILEALAAASGFTAILVFALYLNGLTAATLYQAPERLSLLCVILVYWLGRVLILAHRGQMHDDPVVFAATDRASLICGVVAAAIIVASL